MTTKKPTREQFCLGYCPKCIQATNHGCCKCAFKEGQLSQKNKCCVEDCNKKSTHSLGNNLMNSIHFCKEHLDLFQVHLTAREEMFKEQGQLSQQNKDIETINDDYPNILDKKDRYNFIEWKEKVIKQIQGGKG